MLRYGAGRGYSPGVQVSVKSLPPTDPENHNFPAAVLDAMHRLGLDLKRGKGPIETLVIDYIERPSEN